MNGFTRFIALGLHDADRRVAAALAHPPLDQTDRYLRDSALVSAIDRVTIRLRAWWLASAMARVSRELRATLAGRDQAERYHSIAVAMLSAVSVHVVLTLVQGPAAGWFWVVIPSMAAMFALLLAAASRFIR